MSTYKGKISRFIYKGENGFAIAIFILFNNEKKSITLTGPIGLMRMGIVYEITGEEVDDIKRNQKNFAVKSFSQVKHFDKEGLIKYLSSPTFPTVGKKLAENIVNHFGEDLFKKIIENKSELFLISEMTEAKAQIIYDVVVEKFGNNKVLDMFVENNLKMEFLNLLQQEIEDMNIIEQILNDDFYTWANENKLQPFSEIDRVAVAFGMNEFDEKRISWYACEFVKEILFKEGNTYTSLEELTKKLRQQFPNLEGDLYKKLVYAKNEKILYFKNEKIYTKESYEDEQYIAKELFDLASKSHYIKREFDFDLKIKEVEKFISSRNGIENFKYNEEQVEAIKNFIDNDISIITGGPGTGKTTVITGIVKMYELVYNDSNFAITAPTGRAAGKIKDDSGYKTSTIHRLLQYSGNDVFEANESKPIYRNLVVIDECSMIDNHLFASLLKGVKGINKILLVGDVEQLPSVSYGNLYEDLIESKQFKTTRLIKNNRQKTNEGELNSIIELSNAIKNEEVKEFDFANSTNVNFVFSNDFNQSINILKETYLNINPSNIEEQLNNIQIIAPMYKEALGIDNINSIIQNLVNPTNSKVYKRYDAEFRVNDKVMYIENDPTFELSNGDVGYIKELNFIGDKFKTAKIIFNEREIEMGLSSFNKVKLNYACSIHKTQGSEYKNTILVLDGTNRVSNFVLNKKMLYTAITRAKERLIIISDSNLFVKSCYKNAKQRLTTLKETISLLNNI
ncbi:SF1B family DNA helicase RecD2 [Spiroplasma monobiae]|uniref:Exodeoxyribonuclease V alpha subunit n=1 Tax=Spiroplasma monobiae MQ-1 TaxID=1336748 RepID=A0A2K9LUN9_SPISQ|nr:AAA family ATPase [Spiroplasma monobiae]AUM62631.1 exodeoxyribonuclease V alpha subunit [Spiroplasma monobiae MQ-1]